MSPIPMLASAVGGVIGFVVVFAIAVYFVPLIIAILRKKSNVVAIGALNLLLGWSLIGWVVSLVWALSKDQAQTIVVQNVSPSNQRDLL